jgi:glycosyltransferase involved in cell wall biosynthesis
MRITFVASTYRMGGAERSTFELACRLRGDGDDVDAVALREPGAVGEMFMRSGVPFQAGLGGGPKSAMALAGLRRHFQRRRTEVVYFLDHTNAVFWGIGAARLARVPVRLMVMHTTGLWGGGNSLPLGVRAALPGLTRVIATAAGQETYLRRLGVPEAKLVTIRNGVDTCRRATPEERLHLRRELGLHDNDLAVGMIAMFRPEKAHEMLFEALRRLRPSFPNLRVFLVGDGPRREELVRAVDRMGLTNVVRFLGVRADAPRLAAAFDVVVLTSLPLVETLPFSLLEAIAQGVPAVATRVGSLAEIIEDGGAGYLVPPGDVDAFGRALAGMLSDPVLRQRLGTQGREWVCREFSVERVVRETRDLIGRLARGDG